MTHNLRTPLATIKAVVSALLASPEQRGDADASELLATAYGEADRLERLVTKVLELARIHAGALDPRFEPTDVGELARVAVRRLRHIATGHRLRLAVDDELLIVSVDPAMIELVLVIALENALRFAPPDTEILVRAEAAGADRRCEIRVVDQGPGTRSRAGAGLRGVREAGSARAGLRARPRDRARPDRRARRRDLGRADPRRGATIALSIPGDEPE